MQSKFLNDPYIPEPIPQKRYSSKLFQYLSTIPLVFYLIAFNFLLFFLVVLLEGERGVWKFGSLHYVLVSLKDEYFRFITAFFLHANSLHVFVNLFSLFMVGPFIEQIFGKVNFFILYMFTGLASTLSSYSITMANESLVSKRITIESMGASGAIYGIVGGLTVFLIINKKRVKQKIRKRLLINIFVILGLNIFGIGFLSDLPIDNAGHIGGLLSGGILAFFLKPEVFGKRKQYIADRFALFFLILLVIAFVWAGWAYLYESRFLIDWPLYF